MHSRAVSWLKNAAPIARRLKDYVERVLLPVTVPLSLVATSLVRAASRPLTRPAHSGLSSRADRNYISVSRNR